MKYEYYSNEQYWEFVPKDQKQELKNEGKLPAHAEEEPPAKNYSVTESEDDSNSAREAVIPISCKRELFKPSSILGKRNKTAQHDDELTFPKGPYSIPTFGVDPRESFAMTKPSQKN
jgi:hypothetical protein